jgi:hypothetical protein
MGEDVYVIIKTPQLTIHIRKNFVPNGEWALHPMKRGVTLSLYEWKELKKTIIYIKLIVIIHFFVFTLVFLD